MDIDLEIYRFTADGTRFTANGTLLLYCKIKSSHNLFIQILILH